MNQKELKEIRRRIRPEHNSIRHIFGCFVNTNKEIISTIDESVGLLSREESEKYFMLLKKSLSGALGKNLLDISFETSQVVNGEEHKLLSALRKSQLEDEVLRDALYHTIIEHIDMEDQNYLILIACDVYDVPSYGKDGEKEDRGDVYQYLLCSICPVKEGKAELGYSAAEKRFHTSGLGQIVSAPELGFLFPAFDGRAANIYNALLYSKNIQSNHQEFVDALFHTPVPVPAARQKETFDEILVSALDKECSFDVVQAVHEQFSERISLYKESKDPEPLTMKIEEVGEIIENSGAKKEKVEEFCKKCAETIGEDTLLSPGNLTNSKKMEISTPEVRITVDPQFSYLIQSRIIDGRKYLLVSADSGVEINGVNVNITDS